LKLLKEPKKGLSLRPNEKAATFDHWDLSICECMNDDYESIARIESGQEANSPVKAEQMVEPRASAWIKDPEQRVGRSADIYRALAVLRIGRMPRS
jgi:hypothetical protein